MTADHPPSRRRWQVGLRTTILLVVVAALGLNIARDRRALGRLREVARRVELRLPWQWQLDATDPRQVAIRKLDYSRGPRNSWEVDLPPGGRYRLCLATRLGRFEDRPAHTRSIAIEPGRHFLSLDEQPIGDGWRVVATWNLVDRLAADETPDWTTNGWFSAKTSPPLIPLGEVVTLEYRGNVPFATTWPPQSPTPIPEIPGVRLWIETEVGPGSLPPPEPAGR